MRRFAFFLIFSFMALLLTSGNRLQAQTLSTCEPSPPMRPNAKPGIGDLNLSRDGKTLVVATGNAEIRFIDLKTGELKRTLRGHRFLLTGSVDRTIVFWDMKTGQKTRTITLN